jgi:hypothetical protein
MLLVSGRAHLGLALQNFHPSEAGGDLMGGLGMVCFRHAYQRDLSRGFDSGRAGRYF